MIQAEVREAFSRQASICTDSGAPLTGQVCRLIGERLDQNEAIGQAVLGWAGNPSHEGDALPLRLAGGLHGLARSGRDKNLSAIYEGPQVQDDEQLWSVLNSALTHHADFLMPWLDGPPQTNEVGRAAALMAGLLVLADTYALPFRLFELGASAGLNTVLDSYGYRLGDVVAGQAGSPVQLSPIWTGQSPPMSKVEIIGRAAVDRNPLDVTDAATRARLSAYVWADQKDRLARLEAALDLAANDPITIDRADAADWLESRLSFEPEPGVCRVVMHTIAYQYFPPDSQRRIRARIEAAGEQATRDAPLAWLRLESVTTGHVRRHELTLQMWPGDMLKRLAVVQPHGATINWVDQTVAVSD